MDYNLTSLRACDYDVPVTLIGVWSVVTITSLRNGVSNWFKCLKEGVVGGRNVGGPVIDPYSGQPKTSDADPTEEAEKQFLPDKDQNL
uniref:Uncharacterized protein n=1 Tax=Tetranychus urticae TaxID=32264 RepID=T1K9F0_TETUR